MVGLAVAGQVEGRPWVPDWELDGVRIVTLFPDAMYHQLDGRRVTAGMERVLSELQPQAMGISGYGMVDSRVALRWCRRHAVARVLMTESKADDAPRRWWKELVKRHLVSQFDSALCGGSAHRAYLEQLGMRSEVIFDKYDVVDNERFQAAVAAAHAEPERFRKLPGLESPRPYFMVSSRFIARKNLPRLLAAFRDYRRGQQDGWRLVILGTGPEEMVLRRLVADESIPDVSFVGFRQFDELVGYYAFAGAFVHPALQEQWGLVVNEAMACGLPVLVSRTVGATHDLVVEGGNGFKFNPENVADIQQALTKVADDPQQRELMAARSLEIIRQWTPGHFANGFWSAVEAASAHSR